MVHQVGLFIPASLGVLAMTARRHRNQQPTPSSRSSDDRSRRASARGAHFDPTHADFEAADNKKG
jgi:hypothetical protein